MKLFQQLLKFYQTMGLFRPESDRNREQKARTLFFLLSFIQLLMSSGAFVLFQAKSIREHIASLSVTITLIVCAIFISICTRKMADTLKLIENLEEFIERSKDKRTYDERKLNTV